MAGGGEVLAAERGSWEVEFSRFFNFPRLPSPSCVDIKPLPKCKGRSRGTWVSASSSSSLSLSLVPNAPPILLVSIPHCIFDEHFVSNLYFSWPQVSCSTECPIRRSRVVFVSYRDCHDQIQKFALRFSSGNEAQAFFDAVKGILQSFSSVPEDKQMWLGISHKHQEISTNSFQADLESPESSQGLMMLSYLFKILRKTKSLQEVYEKSLMDDVPNHKFPRNDFVCEDMLPSEHTASNALRYGADEESTFADSDVTYRPEMPVLNSQDEQHASCQQALVNNFGAIFSTLPRSFTELLFNSDHEPPKAQEDIDHKSEISRYMLDSSLHVMLTKMEQVIRELGGDLTLI